MLHVTLPRNSMRRVRLRSSIEKSSTECGWKVHWNNEENFKDTELPVLELSDNQKEKIGVLLQLQPLQLFLQASTPSLERLNPPDSVACSPSYRQPQQLHPL